MESIIRDGLIRIAPCGIEAVSTSIDRDVAISFGLHAAMADKAAYGQDAFVKLLKIDSDQMIIDGYRIKSFSDPVWGAGECDWEKEFVCYLDIPMRYVTVEDAI